MANLKLTVNTPVTWEGSLFRPVVLTAQDDHSVGQKIGNASQAGQNSYYATTALCLDAATNVVSSFQLAHLRIAHATTAIELKQKSGHILSHVQLVNCATGIAPTGTEFALRNALFHNVPRSFDGGTSTGRIEHLTVNGATWFHYGSTFSQLYVTNSLLVGVANVGTLVNTNQVAVLSGAGGVFTSVLAGNNYLTAGSPYRNAGTPYINPDLAADFGQMTTHAPALVTTNFTVNTTLTPWVPRDNDLPDLGWHYPVLDFVWTSLTVNTGVTLTLLNGVAVGAYGPRLLTLSGSGKVTSTGLPEQLNRLVTYNAVQEQPQTWITNAAHTTFSGANIGLRFTDVSFLAAPSGGRQMLGSGSLANMVTIRDSSLRGLYWYFFNSSGTGHFSAGITLRNNHLERCFLHLEQGYTGAPYYLSLAIHNCLFSRTTVEWMRSLTYYGNWSIHDNLFDNSTLYLSQFSSYDPIDVVGYNGFINTSNPLGGSGNKTGLLRDFVKGPLGNFYYPPSGPTNSLASLINADTTRTAAGVGLAQYTTTVNQAKDTGHLDIGFHYVATVSHLASSGFSGSQGANGWWYLYAPLKGTASGYLTNYSGTYWYNWTTGSDQYTRVYSILQHPGNSYDSIRRFVSPRDGRVWISGTANRTQSGGVDGTDVRILRNDTPLTGWIDVPNNTVPVEIHLSAWLWNGDAVDFQVNKKTSNGSDSTTWDPRISYDTPVDSDGDGLPDWFEDSNGDGVQSVADGGSDTDGDGIIDRLDANPFDPLRGAFSIRIDVPVHGSTLAN